MSNEFIRIATCPVCGKKYVPAAQHIYKIGHHCVCSWGCQRKVEKAKEKEAQEKKQKDGVKSESKGAARRQTDKQANSGNT